MVVIIFIITIFSSSCSQSQNNTEKQKDDTLKTFTTVHSQTSEIKNFWTEFKNAVIEKDTGKLVTMIDFSVNSGLIGKNKNEFYSNFNSLFDTKTVEIITGTENLTRADNNEYFFVGSGAYKFFYFKKINGKFKLYTVFYYD